MTNRLYIILAMLALAVGLMLIACNQLYFVPPVQTLAQPLQELTVTQIALDITATYLATYQRPHPSMTYYGESYMGISPVRTAEAMREFDTEYARFQYAGTNAVRTITAEASLSATP
jgi:hypothetical protein